MSDFDNWGQISLGIYEKSIFRLIEDHEVQCNSSGHTSIHVILPDFELAHIPPEVKFQVVLLLEVDRTRQRDVDWRHGVEHVLRWRADGWQR